jgi:hypothetical protein
MPYYAVCPLVNANPIFADKIEITLSEDKSLTAEYEYRWRS